MTDEELVKEWLKTNKPLVVGTNDKQFVKKTDTQIKKSIEEINEKFKIEIQPIVDKYHRDNKIGVRNRLERSYAPELTDSSTFDYGY